MPLYKILSDGKALEKVDRKGFSNEKELHSLIEHNLMGMLGIRLIASEYPIPNGRIDTLGLDEDGIPVIIEYKWKKDLSAIVQGLFYLDWVMQNKRPFESIVKDKLGKDVNWSTQPRLLIIARDFDVKELAAINQMGPRIELIRYSLYDGLLNIENVNIVESKYVSKQGGDAPEVEEHTIEKLVKRTSPEVRSLFFQLRDRLRQDKRTVVLDLKPEGFQLIKFKDQVLDYLEEGTREHTITAFWEYLLLLEICHKLLQKDRMLHLRDHELYSPYLSLESTYDNDEYVSEGDFAERMLKITQRIAQDFEAMRGDAKEILRLSSGKITQFLYKHDISDLRSQIVSYLQHKPALWILFDNLDKGWPPHGIKPEDVFSLRCLLDAIWKLERAFQRQGIPTTGIIFIRNDVYENMVATMPDRGKISQALVDWTDAALLLELLRRRFLCSGVDGNPSFEDLWRQVCVSHIRGEETSHYMIERCLMRPRSLIDLLRFCRSHAINLRHQRIEVEDIDHGEEQYSTQLVNDISYEMQDVFPPAKDSLYGFIECPSELDDESLRSIMAKISDDISIQEKVFNLLLWYGVLGFRGTDGEPKYIYSVRYNMKRMQSLIKKRTEENIVYLINPAFWKALEVSPH